ncbi:hypothetical protein [uncultured Halopseudomonas sp.]|uniref:hypothetical protein n=1 Tax=uncultured Halopseudomonas sp. TaxID=2901193 RepID=UPI0030ED052F|tara:strand:+ start:17075 stop:17371 length:297 start_codon:yes stop_codon:yes gene_type:complete
MKYSNIIGTTAITLALGVAAPFAVAEMHGDHDKDMKHDAMSEHHDEKKAMNSTPDANELGDRSDTSMGIEARPGSDGTDRDVPGEPEVGLDAENEPGY